MFQVFVNDGTQEMPDDDILYIVSKEGVYLKKKLGIMESITPVKNISVLQSVDMMATMHIKPIPGTLFAQVMDFFKKVYDEYYAEAIVLLFYNEARRTYKAIPPAQQVSGAAVDYNRAVTLEGHIMVGDIHSHANMSAFHSGIDDDDEKSFDGLHITIGNKRDEEVSISTSIVSNGQRFIADTMDYVNGLKRTVDIDDVVDEPVSTYYVYNHKTRKMEPRNSGKTRRVRRFDQRFVSTISKRHQKCPDAWLDLVEKRTYNYAAYGTANWQGGRGGQWWKNWDQDKFDKDAWKKNKATKPGILPTQTTQRVMFPPHAQGPIVTPLDGEKVIPCEACPFKETAKTWVMQEFMESVGDDELSKYIDEQGNPIDWYECVECSTVFYTSEEMAVCPQCKVDDHLVLLEPDEIQLTDEGAESTETEYDGPQWWQCNRCKQVFDSMSDTPECPSCHKDDNIVLLHEEGPPTPYKSTSQEPAYEYKCKKCATESNTLNHGQCPFCGGDVEDLLRAHFKQKEEDALTVAAEADETLESTPLQVPDDDKIPLGTRKKKKRRPGVFASLFQGRNKKT